MKKKKKESVELRFYEVPQNESALVLAGQNWEHVSEHEEINIYGEPKLHFHNLMEIGYCKRGVGQIVFEEQTHRYETGTIIIIPENYPHTIVSDGEDSNDWEYIIFDPKTVLAELYSNNPNAIRDIVQSINRGAMIVEAEQVVNLSRIMEAILDEEREQKPYSSRMIQFFTGALVVELMRLNKEIPYYPYEAGKKTTMGHIATAVNFVENHYQEPIRISDISKACNMSETHFRRTFEEYINMAPADYVNLVRVQKACNLLRNTDDSMDGIAMKCGFSTTSTLNRNFKKYMGTSPYQWKLSSENGKSFISTREKAGEIG